MPHRDPETGKFVAGSGTDSGEIEMVSDQRHISISANSLDGSTGQFGGEETLFEGLQLYDLDEILDRDESARLVYASHEVEVYVNSTSTSDGTFRFSGEFSASPARQVIRSVDALQTVDDIDGATNEVDVNAADPDDTQDLLGPGLTATGFAPFSDGATGVGGAAGAGTAGWEGQPGNPQFHPRDEVFLNGCLTAWNIADAAVHVDVDYQHIYVVEE